MKRIVVCLALAASTACITSASDPFQPGDVQLGDEGLRVLFVGNSLTYFNNLPALVQTIAEAAGHPMSQADISSGGFSLEDHYNTGAPEAIRRLKPDVVVLQQGPSSLPANQIYLRDWTVKMNESIQAAGSRPALYMVWPEWARKETAFPDVRTSYSNAAEAVGGIFIPAGESWRELWGLDPEAGLYGPDGLHPTQLGSVVAALTIYRMLFDEPVTELPARLEPTSAGLPVINFGEDQAAQVYQAVESAVGKWGRR